MTSKSLHLLKLHALMLHYPKGAPRRKPTPVYFGWCRMNYKSISGIYVRFGSFCLALSVY